jgi:hypothetical protein
MEITRGYDAVACSQKTRIAISDFPSISIPGEAGGWPAAHAPVHAADQRILKKVENHAHSMA